MRKLLSTLDTPNGSPKIDDFYEPFDFDLDLFGNFEDLTEEMQEDQIDCFLPAFKDNDDDPLIGNSSSNFDPILSEISVQMSYDSSTVSNEISEFIKHHIEQFEVEDIQVDNFYEEVNYNNNNSLFEDGESFFRSLEGNYTFSVHDTNDVPPSSPSPIEASAITATESVTNSKKECDRTHRELRVVLIRLTQEEIDEALSWGKKNKTVIRKRGRPKLGKASPNAHNKKIDSNRKRKRETSNENNNPVKYQAQAASENCKTPVNAFKMMMSSRIKSEPNRLFERDNSSQSKEMRVRDRSYTASVSPSLPTTHKRFPSQDAETPRRSHSYSLRNVKNE